ncbi:MAG: hypothetical protein HOK50_06995, partial [Kordiimonadaceae bacterium]|nr:hypothetical protein [Kordiimonadaceae bacterium]
MKCILKLMAAVFITSLFLPLTAQAEGDAVKGEGTFKKKCKICHTVA